MSAQLTAIAAPARGADAPVASRRFALWFPLTVFVLTRVYGALILQLLSHQPSTLDAGTKPGYHVHAALPADPGYLGIITNWDGQWYQSIASDGYRVLVPNAPGAADALWEWAFPPIFPMLTGLLMRTGMSFPWAATVVNGIAGAAAMVVVFALLNRAGGRFIAMSGVSLLCCFITAPLLQAAYSESLALLLLGAALLALTTRRYGWAFVAIVLLAFTRIVTPPLAIVVVIHALARLRARREDPLSRREVVALGALAATSLAGALMWSSVARALAPVPTGATSRPQSLTGHLGWFSDAYTALGWPGPAIVGLGVLTLVLLAARPSARAWGLEVRTWLWSYPLFILSVTPITTGILRYLLLCFPLGLVVAGDPRTVPDLRHRGLVVGGTCLLGLALQWWWVGQSFVVHPGSLMP